MNYKWPLILIAIAGCAFSSQHCEAQSQSPTHAWFDSYVKAFNSQDPTLFATKYFSPDIVFHRNNGRDTTSRDLYIKQYISMHDGLAEYLHPQAVVIDGDIVAAELDVEFRASKDQPDFILRPVKRGDVFVVKMFAFYRVKNGQIQSITDAHWTPQVQ